MNVNLHHVERRRICNICNINKVAFLGIQETRLSKIDILMVKQLWGNMSFDFATSSAMGLSGGIMSIWDPLVFSCYKMSSYQNVLIVHGKWLLDRFKVTMMNVYASQDIGQKRLLWTFISEYMSSNDGLLIELGFWKFQWGYAFTRLSLDGKKMSKLDRFFISEGVSVVCPDLSANVLNNVVSDHRPILLKQEAMDYGPRVFRFFNSWLDEKDFEHVVVSSWNGDDQMARSNLYSLDSKDIKDLAQKAKIKWSIEGDENSRYFYEIINSKRRYLAIRGIKREGTWVFDPSQVKVVFLNHFRGKFSRMENVTISKRNTRFKSLSEEQSIMLIGPISMHELKDAVWSCGNDKAPGPDGFTFSLVKTYWEILKTDILEFVSEFFVTGFIPTGCNSSFITLIPKVINPMGVSDYRPISLIGIQYKIIAKVLALRLAKVVDSIVSLEQTAFVKGRQILDGPMLVNEVLAWMMEFMHFPIQWRKWIRASLHLARASILINESPTVEFRLQRGLRQGDPLSPFLFLIAMKGLRMAMEDAIASNFFQGLKIENDELSISHLLYADDVLFMGEWSSKIIHNLLIILHYFYVSSGLKINLHKSNLYGIGVKGNEVQIMAQQIRVCHGELSFDYLGLSVGGQMYRIKAWEGLVNRFHKRLSKWKVSTLSIGGRAMLIKTVLGCTIAERWNNGFWDRKWRRNIRGGIEQCQFTDLMSRLSEFSCSDVPDRWWVALDRIPTRSNLLMRGINLSDIMCAICGNGIEERDHVFSSCDVAVCTRRAMFRSLQLSTVSMGTINDTMQWVDSCGMPEKKKKSN
nr:putative RNA-directed DNA polymerase, eukaryota, reverse transcriptase zinc-binding domain protein [Tanacetum cinerariifolium]